MEYFNEIWINIESSKQLEEDTSNQNFRIKLNPDVKKYKIKPDNAFKVYIGQKQFDFLCTAEPNQMLRNKLIKILLPKFTGKPYVINYIRSWGLDLPDLLYSQFVLVSCGP